MSALFVLAATFSAGPAELAVLSTTPPRHTMASGTVPLIEFTLDRPIDPVTATNATVRVLGKWSGPLEGMVELDRGNTLVRFVPTSPVSAGDLLTVQVSRALLAADGGQLQVGGYAWQFMMGVSGGGLSFTQTQNITTNGPGESTVPYGGVATDVDHDGWLDVTLTCEDTADLRVFLNRADGTCRTESTYQQPTTPLGFGASPSDVADFNHDGHADLCITCNASDRVVIALGNGAGGFTNAQQFTVSGTPRGIVAFDIDGDGDDDVIAANDGISRLQRFVNNGAGSFAAPVSFDTPATGERSLAAVDMNEDGRLDLVVGDINQSRMLVLRSLGDGTFSSITNVPCGGNTWMIMCGDLNGDGHADVTSVNSSAGNASVLFGDGAGGLGSLATYVPDPFPIATDLGDLDGDGDLDWVTSSFSGEFFVYQNLGNGAFQFSQEFPAAGAASCALMADFDNDRDLDVALVDEVADRLMMQQNLAVPVLPDLNGDGTVAFADLLMLLGSWGPCLGCAGDFDGDGAVGFTDLLRLLAEWE